MDVQREFVGVMLRRTNQNAGNISITGSAMYTILKHSGTKACESRVGLGCRKSGLFITTLAQLASPNILLNITPIKWKCMVPVFWRTVSEEKVPSQ